VEVVSDGLPGCRNTKTERENGTYIVIASLSFFSVKKTYPTENVRANRAKIGRGALMLFCVSVHEIHRIFNTTTSAGAPSLPHNMDTTPTNQKMNEIAKREEEWAMDENKATDTGSTSTS
jgi:hypothetical protein